MKTGNCDGAEQIITKSLHNLKYQSNFSEPEGVSMCQYQYSLDDPKEKNSYIDFNLH